MGSNHKSNLPGATTAQTTAEVQQSEPANRSGSHWRPTEESYTVQQAAALTGLSEHTLRYYERIGLIEPVQRQESSKHRRYSSDDLVRLEALACLRATGMPIEQMRRYFELGFHLGDSANPVEIASELRGLLSAHLQELQRRMTELQAHIEYVQLKIDFWRAVEANDEQTAASIARKAQELIHATMLPSLPTRSATDTTDQPS